MTDFWSKLLANETPPSFEAGLSDNAIYPLEQFRFIEVAGVDAEKFLQGQLSSDVSLLSLTQSGLGSHSTAKGRMLSSFRIAKNADDSFLLRIHQSIAEQALSALNKYIVFSKAEAAINNLVAFGLHGADAAAAVNVFWSELKIEDYQASINEHGLIICSSAKLQSFEIYCTEEKARELWQALSSKLSIHTSCQHTLLENQLGLAFVEQSSYELFTPQTYNYQLTPAISFKKGCYTGQEIVARLHYLGKLKRHSYHYLVETDAKLEAGTEISLADSDKNIGHILSAVQCAEKQWDVIINLVEEYASENELSSEQQAITVLKRFEIDYETNNKSN
jgi:folate-binding protein YgfZ